MCAALAGPCPTHAALVRSSWAALSSAPMLDCAPRGSCRCRVRAGVCARALGGGSCAARALRRSSARPLAVLYWSWPWCQLVVALVPSGCGPGASLGRCAQVCALVHWAVARVSGTMIDCYSVEEHVDVRVGDDRLVLKAPVAGICLRRKSLSKARGRCATRGEQRVPGHQHVGVGGTADGI